MSEPDGPPPPDPPRDLELEPIGRDRRFIVRLILMLIVGFIVASFIGLKLKGAARGCGGGLIQPGSSVIPPANGSTH